MRRLVLLLVLEATGSLVSVSVLAEVVGRQALEIGMEGRAVRSYVERAQVDGRVGGQRRQAKEVL